MSVEVTWTWRSTSSLRPTRTQSPSGAHARLNPSPPTLHSATSGAERARTSQSRKTPSEPREASCASCVGFHATRSVPVTGVGCGVGGGLALREAAAVGADAGAGFTVAVDAGSLSSVEYFTPGRSGFQTRRARASAAAMSVPRGFQAKARTRLPLPAEDEDDGGGCW